MREMLAVITLAIVAPLACADERSRVFDSHYCRYSLPGDNWTWRDLPAGPEAICMAQGADGCMFMLTVRPAHPRMAINERFARNVDQSTFAAQNIRKRGGRLTTFQGLPCYESCAVLTEESTAAEMTAVFRFVVANGYVYSLQVLGDADPVEERPDFAAIMDGFELLPTAAGGLAANASANRPNIYYTLGQIVAGCLLAAAAIAVIQRMARWAAQSGRER